MKGVILAAGLGSRLHPLTEDKPKCLVEVAGKKILDYQLDAYRHAKIKDIIIIVGYKGYLIDEYCRYIRDLNIEIIYNDDYENTNNMYSLYLAKSKIYSHSFILNNADLVIDTDIVKNLVSSSYNDLVAVDVGLYNHESMKISCNAEGNISDISKTIDINSSIGCSIDFYKISSNTSKILFDEISMTIESGNKKDWTEVAFQKLFKNNLAQFNILDVSNKKWVEVDNLDDLALADEIFSQINKSISNYKLYLFDLDGTIYIGNSPINGVTKNILKLRKNNKIIKFISNNSSKSKSDYVTKLSALGITCNEEDIILSTDSVINFLSKNDIKNIFVLGTKKLFEEFLKNKFNLTDNTPELLVIGYDTELNYEKLVIACKLITKNNIDYIVTHRDLYCPTENGPIPDAGAIALMIEKTTGKKPLKIFGKPDIEVLLNLQEKLHFEKEETIFIGDRLHTDILMANNFGIDSILVLSGETNRYMVENSDIKPTYILPYFKLK